MKKLLTIFTLVMVVFASSCSKDDDVIGESDSVVGRWVLEKMEELNSKETVPFTDGIEFTFKADGTFTGFTNDIDFDGEDPIIRKVPTSGTYKLSSNGEKITIMQKDEDNEEYNIHTLTTRKMILRGNYDDFNVQITFNKK
ncbi:lipocalin family protein [Sphingobacterium sp. MYb388]|uniref:lipocalin family protein n=1 Tax=Sphingobacterium sp. MYb388 TaxID=2745437 RepID=UPI0030A51D14